MKITDMARLYSVWDALLYLSGGEGFGMPAWEAMCAGLPVIYSNYSSHAELLNNAKAGIGVGGILQPEKHHCIWRMIADMPETIMGIRRLYYNTDLRRELGRNGRQYASRHSVKIVAAEWHKIFQSEN